MDGLNVYCWDQTDNEWLPVDWEYTGSSKALYAYASPGCVGNNSAIGAYFNDDNFVVGPRLVVTGERAL